LGLQTNEIWVCSVTKNTAGVVCSLGKDGRNAKDYTVRYVS